MKSQQTPGWLRPVLALVGIGALIAIGKAVDAPARLRDALEWVQQLGWLGVGVFVGLYTVACVLFLPGSILTLGAGVVFGVVKGSIIVSVASTLGATVAFLVGRYLASPLGFQIDRAKGEARISSIFKWYGKDFPSVRDFIEKHSDQSLKRLTIRYLDYDWSLNGKGEG